MPQVSTTKTRYVLPPPSQLGVTIQTNLVGGVPVDTKLNFPFLAHLYAAKESVTSVSHKRPFREGGPFQVRRYSIRRGTLDGLFDVKRPNGNLSSQLEVKFGGTCIATQTAIAPYVITQAFLDTGFAAMLSSFPSIDLNSYGPGAINRLSPLNPGANLGQFLGELREGLPQIPLRLFRRAQFFKSLGSEYLNAEFGWKPFIKDLQDMYNTWQKLNDKMAQIIRDNGRPIRRRATLRYSVTSTEPEDLGPFVDTRIVPRDLQMSADNDFTNENNQAKLTKRVKTEEFVWASARTRYFIPDVTDDQWNRKAKLALFGLNPTPSLIWELMPWSWLVDWFSNVGDVIDNLSSNGIAELLIDYAYVMRSYRKTTSYTTQSKHMQISPWGVYPYAYTTPGSAVLTEIVNEQKERVAASPFGFALRVSDLSVRQLAILTSLGLSRSNFLP